MDYDNQHSVFRVITIGDSSVGKTSIINKLVNNQFDPHEASTVGAMFVLIVEEIEKTRVEMQIWDTAGQEKFRSLGPIYYRSADAAIVVFDFTQRRTFDNLDSWVEVFSDIAGEDALIVIAGNKSDLADSYQIEDEMAREWAEKNGYMYFATSALEGSGIKDMFKAITERLYGQSKKVTTSIKEKDDGNSGCKC